MKTLQQEFETLITLTKEYIYQEYKNEEHGQIKKEWVNSELETYTYFKEYAGQLKKQETVIQNEPPATPAIHKTFLQPVSYAPVVKTSPEPISIKTIENIPTETSETEKKNRREKAICFRTNCQNSPTRFNRHPKTYGKPFTSSNDF